MKAYDRFIESLSRGLARRVSRRSMLRSLTMLVVGGATIPLLPVARGQSRSGDDPVLDRKSVV